MDKKLALEYYEKLSAKLLQRVPKVVTGVAESVEEVPEYQLEEI
jgi:hypothetical protein